MLVSSGCKIVLAIFQPLNVLEILEIILEITKHCSKCDWYGNMGQVIQEKTK